MIRSLIFVVAVLVAVTQWGVGQDEESAVRMPPDNPKSAQGGGTENEDRPPDAQKPQTPSPDGSGVPPVVKVDQAIDPETPNDDPKEEIQRADLKAHKKGVW